MLEKKLHQTRTPTSGSRINGKKFPKQVLPSSDAEELRKGVEAEKQGKPDEAAKHYLAAWKANPKNDTAMRLLMSYLYKKGERNKVARLLGWALQQNPTDQGMIIGLSTLAADMRLWETVRKIQNVHIRLAPNNANAYVRLAFAMHNLEQFDETIEFLKNVIPMFPEEPELWNVVGMCLSSKGDFEKAVYFFKEALRLAPTHRAVLQNLGKCLTDAGRIEEAIPYLESAITDHIDLTSANARITLSQCYLHKERFEEGWKHYEWRLQKEDENRIRWRHGLQRWEGEDLSTKSLLFCPEQGIGDELFAAAALPIIQKNTRELHIGCDTRLVSLYQRSFPTAKSVGAYIDKKSNGFLYRELPLLNFMKDKHGISPDYYVEAMTAFARHAMSQDDLRMIDGGFLVPDPEEVKLWKSRFDTISDRPKIGICWRSQKITSERARSYISLEQFLPVLKMDGCDFINLQYGDCRDELKHMKEQHGIEIHNWDDINLKQEIDRAAALTKACDLVITVASAPGMIAFGVGAPTMWMSPLPGWWCFGKYPTVPIFKSARFITPNKFGAWDEVTQMTKHWVQKFLDAPKPISSDFWSATDA